MLGMSNLLRKLFVLPLALGMLSTGSLKASISDSNQRKIMARRPFIEPQTWGSKGQYTGGTLVDRHVSFAKPSKAVWLNANYLRKASH